MQPQIFEEIIDVVVPHNIINTKEYLKNGYVFTHNTVLNENGRIDYVMVKKRYFYFMIDDKGRSKKYYINPSETINDKP